MKRIFFIMPAMLGGGAERVVTLLSEYLTGQGYPVRICLLNRDLVEYKLPAQVVVDTSFIRPGKGILKPLWRLRDLRVLMKLNHEGVFISFFSMFNIYLLAASLGLKRKIVVSERLDPAKSIPNKKWLFALRSFLYRRATKIVFQTPEAMAFFKEKVRMKGIVIPNPLKDGLPERYDGMRRKEVVSFARLEPQKNFPMLIDAFRLFVEKYPEYKLSIYGKGSSEDMLKQKVMQDGLSAKVFFPGFVPDLHEKIRDCAMFVLPSDYEGLSNSMLEAMAIGLPCICTDCPPGGAKMFIRDGENGFLTSVRDISGLFKIMDRLAGDGTIADKISQEAVKVKELLNKDKICRLWENILAD
jgi:GalNAc-alpha-(1->4)-GalNAc-alpha-(1->3)-diNAcBac-PP-undecaprenol alpha-1,4-N-acetyl-D-galactosaminyltransferase